MHAIKEKIKKLLALAASSNKNEAELAFAMAQKLMDEHRISEIELEISGEKLPEKIIQDNVPLLEGMIREWKLSLISVLAKFNNCKVVQFKNGRKTTVIGYGKPSDLDILRFIFTQATLTITNIAQFACMFKGKSYYDPWYRGCVSGIHSKLIESRKSAITEKSFALVKFENTLKEIDDFIAKNIGELTTAKPRNVKNQQAFANGFNRGRNIDLENKDSLNNVQNSIGVK